jgi:hypothetical protein
MDGSAYRRNLAERHTARCETVEFVPSSRSSERGRESFFLLTKLIMDGRKVAIRLTMPIVAGTSKRERRAFSAEVDSK